MFASIRQYIKNNMHLLLNNVSIIRYKSEMSDICLPSDIVLNISLAFVGIDHIMHTMQIPTTVHINLLAANHMKWCKLHSHTTIFLNCYSAACLIMADNILEISDSTYKITFKKRII